MRSETLVLTVLPLTTATDADFNVSLHIAPRLVPDLDEEPLGTFELFSSWTKALANAKIELRDQNDEIIEAKVVPGIDEGLWSRVFSPETPVRRADFGNYLNRDWRSFPVKTVHDLATLSVLYGTLLYPLDPPDLKTLIKKGRRREGLLFKTISSLADEEKLTEELDAAVLRGEPVAGTLGAILTPLHQVRRFYERREAQQKYQASPDAGRKVEPLNIPKPDFHERVAHLADHPTMLRRLGLVIDLKVVDRALLKAATALHAKIAIRGSGTEVIAARTPVAHQGDRLLTQPRGSDWTGGRLRLGNQKLYATLAMDSDGAALKLENFIRSMPRMLAMAENGDPGTVAPAALRSEGFAVVRTGRVDDTKAQMNVAATMIGVSSVANPPTIATEDVIRGFRVEVWDDHERRWFSPHLRLSTAEMIDGTPIYSNLAEAGYVQTAAVSETPGVSDSPLYLHESVFGWSGWSLSTPRPGPRAVADGPKEKVEPAKLEAKMSAVTFATRVQPGTLPRLRYGRSYAFRAWGVDLAGNSHGGDVPQPVPVIRGPLAGEQPLTASIVARPITPVAELFPDVHVLARQIAGNATAPTAFDQIASLRQVSSSPVAEPKITGFGVIDRIVTPRLAMRTQQFSATVEPSTLIADTMRSAVADVQIDTTRAIDAAMFDHIDLTLALPQTDETITPLTPFRRWDPVPPPVVVARHRFSAAESIHHIVIRSGITDDAKIVDPATYIAATGPKDAIDWRATSERHFAAPKGSQHLNELHGRFDAGLDSDDAARRRLLGAALRDDGTLFDLEIVSLTDPAKTIVQAGVSLQAGPEIVNPVTNLAQFVAEKRGDPIPAGHYVVHDIDALALPYLPDPLAVGIALGMPGANRGSPLFGLFRTESTVARYAGDWPAPAPIRLVLESATQAKAKIVGGVITIGLPPGTKLELRLSSSMRREDLELMALWMLIPEALRKLDLITRPAADGQLWGLTPFEKLTLVHAVPRPVLPPLITALVPFRSADQTNAVFGGVIDCHAQSTDRIEAEASWTEWIDDIIQPEPLEEVRTSVAYSAQIDPEEDMVVLAGDDNMLDIAGLGSIRLHQAKHEFGDTKHRLVTYKFRGTTRFREYFSHDMLATVDSRSLVSEPVSLHIPSSAEPPTPLINSIIPLFRWDEETDPGQPFGFRRRRRSGLRIYLERPWFRTGADEQLAILFSAGDTAEVDHVSLWGADPVWLNAGPPNRFAGLAVEDLLGSLGLDNVRGSDPRLTPAALLTLPRTPEEIAKQLKPVTVFALGYRPEYNAARKLWFVDVAMEPAAAVWPFVRLAVARYQPHALPGKELSRAVLCDYAQLPPERTMTVSRPDDADIRVTVTGPIGLRETSVRSNGNLAFVPESAPSDDFPLGRQDPTHILALNRRVIARVETRAADHVSDLDWQTVHMRELTFGGVSPTGEWAWTGVVPIGAKTGPARPGDARQWRVTVEEREGIEADPEDLDENGPLTKEWRLIYADQTML